MGEGGLRQGSAAPRRFVKGAGIKRKGEGSEGNADGIMGSIGCESSLLRGQGLNEMNRNCWNDAAKGSRASKGRGQKPKASQ